MIQRCSNPNTKAYKNYGMRGISVCERWMEFSRFDEDMGEPPTPAHTLDRKDNNGHYEPSNCRWATPQEQGANMRRNVLITVNNETRCVKEWSRIYGLSWSTIHNRLRRGWAHDIYLFAKRKTRFEPLTLPTMVATST